MRISDWSSDVCSSDLGARDRRSPRRPHRPAQPRRRRAVRVDGAAAVGAPHGRDWFLGRAIAPMGRSYGFFFGRCQPSTVTWRARATVSSPAGASLPITEPAPMVAPLPIVTGATSDALEPMKARSEEHTSELQSLMRISYADFCV